MRISTCGTRPTSSTTGELVFNVGERVTTMTSPFLTLIQVPFYWAFGEMRVAYKVVSLLMLLATCLIVLERFPTDPFLRAVGLGVLLISPTIAILDDRRIGGCATRPYRRCNNLAGRSTDGSTANTRRLSGWHRLFDPFRFRAVYDGPGDRRVGRTLLACSRAFLADRRCNTVGLAGLQFNLLR